MWYILQTILFYLFAFVVSFIIFLVLYYKYAFKHWEKLKIPYYPNPSFPLGNMDPNFSKKIGQTIAKIYLEMKNKGHDYCGYYLFAMPIFMPINPKMNKYFLQVNFHSFGDRGFVSDEKNDPMGSSLITWHGEKWRKMREKLNPAWSVMKTKMMLPIMLKCTSDLKNVIDNEIRNGEPINIQDISKRYTVDVICTCAFGVEGNSLSDPSADFIRHAKMIFTTSIVDNIRLALGQSAPAISRFFRIDLFNPTATSFFRRVVFEAVKYREENGVEREDFLNLMIRLKNNMSIKDGEEKSTGIVEYEEEVTLEQVASQCFLFFIAGFETTSATIQFSMYELAKNKDLQDKAREEVLNEVKKNGNKLDYDVIKQMRYLENILFETLRKYPTVHMLNRMCTEDFTIPDTNIVIKKGTKAVLSTLGIHNDPEFYPEPEKFDPNRFTDEAKAARPPFCYLPFGDGPRICPGLRFGMMEVKICIASLLLKYNFTLHPSSEQIELCSMGNVLGTTEPILLNAERL